MSALDGLKASKTLTKSLYSTVLIHVFDRKNNLDWMWNATQMLTSKLCSRGNSHVTSNNLNRTLWFYLVIWASSQGHKCTIYYLFKIASTSAVEMSISPIRYKEIQVSEEETPAGPKGEVLPESFLWSFPHSWVFLWGFKEVDPIQTWRDSTTELGKKGRGRGVLKDRILCMDGLPSGRLKVLVHCDLTHTWDACGQKCLED